MAIWRLIRGIITSAVVLLPIIATPAYANSITASVPIAGSVLTTAPNSIAILLKCYDGIKFNIAKSTPSSPFWENTLL